MYGNALGDYLPALALRLCLVPAYVLLLVAPDCCSCGVWIHSCRRLEGYSRIIGAVLITSVFTGLALKGIEASLYINLVVCLFSASRLPVLIVTVFYGGECSFFKLFSGVG